MRTTYTLRRLRCWSALLLAGALIVTAAGSLTAPPAQAQGDPAVPVPPGRLVVGDDDGLFTMLADGSEQTYLIREDAANCWLRDGQFSPDDSQLVYTRICGGFSPTDWRATDADGNPDPNRTASVFLFDVATGDTTELVANDGSYQDYASDWSPDGAQVLIYSNRSEDRYNLFLVDVATGEVSQVTQFDSDLGRAEFDPTGQYLLYNRYIIEPNDLRWEIRAYDINAGAEVPVATGVTPRWSPDGEWIIFATLEDASDGADIFVMPAACITEGSGCNATEQAVNITYTPGISEREPMFSADQTQIVFLRDADETPGAVVWDVFRQELRSGRQQNLTNTTSLKERLTGWEQPGASATAIGESLPVVGSINTTQGAANLRSSPTTDGDIVGVANSGQIIFLAEANADRSWYRIVLPEDGASAWLFGNLVAIISGDPANLPVAN